jgi:hypothetical protein
MATTASGNGAIVTVWDQDLSSATPSVRGNASTGALLTIATVSNISVSGGTVGQNTVMGLNECPRVRFEAGITAQSTSPNTSIILELEMY